MLRNPWRHSSQDFEVETKHVPGILRSHPWLPTGPGVVLVLRGMDDPRDWVGEIKLVCEKQIEFRGTDKIM